MVAQVLVNGIITAAEYALISLGFALIYRTAGFIHFSHGIVLTAGAYLTFLLTKWLGLPLSYSILPAVALSVLLGCLIETAVYRPLRRRKASSLILLLASLGVYFALQNIVSMAFGDGTRTIRLGGPEEGINVLGARITPVQVMIIFVSMALFVVVALLMKRTRIGRAMRAVASDPALARLCGIESDRVILFVFAIGSALAGVAGILVALDVNMTPTMGLNALMMGMLAAIIGGVRSIPGVALGALFLGMAQQLGGWKMGPQWQDATAFVILLAFLLFRPQGVLSRKGRSAKLGFGS